MESEKQPRALRILSGSPAYIEDQLNQLGGTYTATSFNYAVVMDELVITVLLIHERELRKMQLLAPGGFGKPQ